jgi:DNA-binding NtrC family response regulator
MSSNVLKPEKAPVENKILLIDDDPDVAALFRRILKGINPDTQLHWHLSAEEGLRALETEGRYVVVICDQQLSGTDTGLDLWRKWRDKAIHTPFVMISSLEPARFFDLVGNGNMSPLFLPKPIRPERVRDLLARFVPPKPAAAKAA